MKTTLYAMPGILPSKQSKDLVETVIARCMATYPNLYKGKPICKKDIYKKSREQRYVKPRSIVISLQKASELKSLKQISTKFQITNATVIHARKTVRDEYQTNKQYRSMIDDIICCLFPNEYDSQKVTFRLVNVTEEEQYINQHEMAFASN